VGDFRELRVWRKAHELALALYRATESFPVAERYGLVAQLRRAGASIQSNLAEGCGRNSDRELARFAKISLGSASEAEYQILLARDLGYLPPEKHTALVGQIKEVRRMLASLIQMLGRSRRAAVD
jgi:four helix bundle protein